MLIQSAGAGKLVTENWNQLVDAAPGVSKAIQNSMARAGAFTCNFREAMEKGEITSDEFRRSATSRRALIACRHTSTLPVEWTSLLLA